MGTISPTKALAAFKKEMTQKYEDLEKRVTAALPIIQKPSRFIDIGDGTITDTWKHNINGKLVTLTWQKEDDDKRRNHADAIAYCEKNEMKLPGEGWHLPGREELQTLVDTTRHNPSIDPIFPNTKSAGYWSSTPLADGPGGAWGVVFNYGYVNFWDKFIGLYVRAVRQHS